MKKTVKYLALLVCCFSLMLTLQSCEEQGPAEKAGEKVDTMMEKAQENLEEAGDKMKEAVEEGEQALDEAVDDKQD
jgi:hypothetical protein